MNNNGYNPQNGYQQNGYQQAPPQGGYQQNAYGNNGYQQAPPPGGYQQNGYQQPPQYGGYNQQYNNYNNDPARELTTNTTMMYSKAITFTQILAFAFSFLRKIKDRIIAASATIK